MTSALELTLLGTLRGKGKMSRKLDVGMAKLNEVHRVKTEFVLLKRLTLLARSGLG